MKSHMGTVLFLLVVLILIYFSNTGKLDQIRAVIGKGAKPNPTTAQNTSTPSEQVPGWVKQYQNAGGNTVNSMHNQPSFSLPLPSGYTPNFGNIDPATLNSVLQHLLGN